MGNPRYTNGFSPTVRRDLLELPKKWKKPKLIFVNSMSDLFHEEVDDDFIIEVFDAMNQANWHRYQILTKRSTRLLEINSKLTWMPHVWLGVSVEDTQHLYRIDHLKQTGAHTKFISFEPLLGPISSANLLNIDWVIAGGESGPKARPINKDWVTDLRDNCQLHSVPFFFKQWGGFNRKKNGRLLEGRIWDDMPGFVPKPWDNENDTCLVDNHDIIQTSNCGQVRNLVIP